MRSHTLRIKDVFTPWLLQKSCANLVGNCPPKQCAGASVRLQNASISAHQEAGSRSSQRVVVLESEEKKALRRFLLAPRISGIKTMALH